MSNGFHLFLISTILRPFTHQTLWRVHLLTQALPKLNLSVHLGLPCTQDSGLSLGTTAKFSAASGHVLLSNTHQYCKEVKQGKDVGLHLFVSMCVLSFSDSSQPFASPPVFSFLT